MRTSEGINGGIPIQVLLGRMAPEETEQSHKGDAEKDVTSEPESHCSAVGRILRSILVDGTIENPNLVSRRSRKRRVSHSGDNGRENGIYIQLSPRATVYISS